MAKQAADVQVGYNGKTYMIPAEISQANARQPGLAAAWIEDQIQAKADRQASAKAAKDLDVENEFRSVKQKLQRVDAHEERLHQQQAAIDAYKAANEAQAAQIEALEAAGTGLGSVSGDARDAAQELALQTTNSAVLLETLRQREDYLTGVIDTLAQRVEDLEGQLATKIEQANALHRSRMQMVLEASNRAVDKGYEAETRAVAAAGVANKALGDAQNSRAMTKDQFTRADVLAMVQGEIRVSAEQIVELVIDSLKPQFPHGFAGPRFDAEYVDQTTRDRVNSTEVRVGMDEAVKRTLKRAGSV